jgi:hypothetical protein
VSNTRRSKLGPLATVVLHSLREAEEAADHVGEVIAAMDLLVGAFERAPDSPVVQGVAGVLAAELRGMATRLTCLASRREAS